MKTSIFVLVFTSALIFSCSSDSSQRDFIKQSEEKEASGSAVQEESTESESAPTSTTYQVSAQDAAIGNELDLGQRNKMTHSNASRNMSQTVISSLAAMEYTGDTLRKFIKTGSMSFEVPQLEKATYHIEDIIFRNGGFITSTELHSDITSTESVRITEDSVLEITEFTLRNDIEFRVPAANLDSTLRQIGRYAKYIDYRNIYAQDVSIELFEEYLKRIREKKHSDRLGKAVSEKGKNLGSVTEAEEALLQSDERKDQSIIETLRKKDAIAFATFTIHFYEKDRSMEKMLAYEKMPEKYEPGFWNKMGKSFAKGWSMLLNFIVALTEGWFVILVLLLAGTWVFRKFFRV